MSHHHDSLFDVQEVVQLTFNSGEQELACMLIEAEEKTTHLHGHSFQQSKPDDGKTLVKLVAGVGPESEDPDRDDKFKITQNIDILIKIRDIFDKHSIKYSTENVLNVHPPNAAVIQALLSSVGNDVISSNNIGNKSMIYEVCDNELAKHVLGLSESEQQELIAKNLKCDKKKKDEVCHKGPKHGTPPRRKRKHRDHD